MGGNGLWTLCRVEGGGKFTRHDGPVVQTSLPPKELTNMKTRWLVTGRLGVLIGLMAHCTALAQEQPVDAHVALRDKLAKARKGLTEHGSTLEQEDRKSLDAALTKAERALSHYEQIVKRGDSRKSAMAPLLVAGGGLIADDATGVGVADDVLIPFVALGIIAVYIGTQSPATDAEISEAWRQVIDRSKDVADVARRIVAERRKKTCYCICGDPNGGLKDRRSLGHLPEWECRAKCTLGAPYTYGQYVCL